jgi:hypothetical protein
VVEKVGLGGLGHLLCTANHIVSLATETRAGAIALCFFDAASVARFAYTFANLHLGCVSHRGRQDCFLGGGLFSWRHVCE